MRRGFGPALLFLAAVAWLGADRVLGQGMTAPALPLGPSCIQGMLCVQHGRILGVSASIPAIAANSDVMVTAAAPGLLPGDNPEITLAVGSNTPQTSIIVGGVFCLSPNVLTIKYGYQAGALTANSTAVVVTLNVGVTR